MTGALRVAKADPDGYTLLMGNSGTQAFSQSLYKTPLYNSIADFTPVGLVTESPRILIARKGLPVNNLQEFVAYVKANQAKMQFGSAGVGSGTHLPCVLLNTAMGVDVTHVPYRGEGPAQQDLIGERIDYMCSTIQTGAVLAKQDQVKGLAIMSEHRAKIIPDVPTTGEQGVSGVEASVWNAFFLPPRAPAPIVAKLNKVMDDTIDDAVVSKRLEDLGLEIVAPERRTPAYLAKFQADEVARWGKVVQAAGISPD
jgi:tripartite-type tricarboxylate transporter receptor subunit TctC